MTEYSPHLNKSVALRSPILMVLRESLSIPLATSMSRVNTVNWPSVLMALISTLTAPENPPKIKPQVSPPPLVPVFLGPIPLRTLLEMSCMSIISLVVLLRIPQRGCVQAPIAGDLFWGPMVGAAPTSAVPLSRLRRIVLEGHGWGQELVVLRDDVRRPVERAAMILDVTLSEVRRSAMARGKARDLDVTHAREDAVLRGRVRL